MSEDLKKVRPVAGSDGKRQGWMIFCPACGCGHLFHTAGPVQWAFNGDEDKPTFSPSMRVNGCLNHEPGKEHYGTCHSFVRDGKIEYLSDCTHAMKGQTVELEPF